MAPKPEILRKRDGDTRHVGKKMHNREDPKGDPITTATLDAPEWLKDYGVELWDHLVARLIKINLLTENDVFAFAICCNEYDIYRNCIDSIHREGYTIENGSQTIPNPFLTIKNKAFDNMNRMMGKFGLTPADRAKIGMELMKGGEKNPLNEMLDADIGKKD